MDEDFTPTLNALRGGFNESLGLTFTRATLQEVVGTLTIGPQHHQPYGVVHGGVYAAMVETLASSGAALHARAHGRHTVGLDNATTFLKATREGTLTGRATPLATGRRTHVWEVAITDEEERLVAKGRVRLLCIEGDAALAGQTVAVTAPESE